MISGAHVMIQSSKEEADKAFFRDVLQLPNVDAGGGFLIFAVPPTEIAVHAGSGSGHELSLMCDDIGAFVEEMRGRDIYCSPAQNQGWGIMTQVTLPGGGRLGVYQPLHKRPQHYPEKSMGAKKISAKKTSAKKTSAKKTSTKTGAKRRLPAAAKAKVSSKRKAAKRPRAKARGR